MCVCASVSPFSIPERGARKARSAASDVGQVDIFERLPTRMDPQDSKPSREVWVAHCDAPIEPVSGCARV